MQYLFTYCIATLQHIDIYTYTHIQAVEVLLDAAATPLHRRGAAVTRPSHGGGRRHGRTYSLFIHNLPSLTQITSANYIAFGGEPDDGFNDVHGQSSPKVRA